MSTLVWIPTEKRVGRVVNQMAYGAIVFYSKGGIDYEELLPEEDYEPLFGLDEIMEDEEYD